MSDANMKAQLAPSRARAQISWKTLPGGDGVTLRPALTEREQAAVRALFNPGLTFATLDDPELGPATVIRPRIDEKDRATVEQKLRRLRSGKDPQRRALKAPGVKAAGTPVYASYASRAAAPPKPVEPTIVFAPSAYLKYLYMCHAHGALTEVGGYGVHHMRPGNVIYVHDFLTVRQHVTPAFCSLDPDHANELLMRLCAVDEEFNPNQLLACWCHTHPGFSITPSGTDWETFDGLDAQDWAAMIILNKRQEIGAHIRQRCALYPSVREVKVSVDWARLPEYAAMIRPDEWEAEYMANVWPSAQLSRPGVQVPAYGTATWPDWYKPGDDRADSIHHDDDGAYTSHWWDLRDEDTCNKDAREELTAAGLTPAEIDDELQLLKAESRVAADDTNNPGGDWL